MDQPCEKSFSCDRHIEIRRVGSRTLKLLRPSRTNNHPNHTQLDAGSFRRHALVAVVRCLLRCSNPGQPGRACHLRLHLPPQPEEERKMSFLQTRGTRTGHNAGTRKPQDLRGDAARQNRKRSFSKVFLPPTCRRCVLHPHALRARHRALEFGHSTTFGENSPSGFMSFPREPRKNADWDCPPIDVCRYRTRLRGDAFLVSGAYEPTPAP